MILISEPSVPNGKPRKRIATLRRNALSPRGRESPRSRGGIALSREAQKRLVASGDKTSYTFMWPQGPRKRIATFEARHKRIATFKESPHPARDGNRCSQNGKIGRSFLGMLRTTPSEPGAAPRRRHSVRAGTRPRSRPACSSHPRRLAQGSSAVGHGRLSCRNAATTTAECSHARPRT